MEKQVGTLTEIIEEEHRKIAYALNKYGDTFQHTLDVFKLMEEFLTDLNATEDTFLRFLYATRNFYLLTLFSIVRLHHVQSSLNLRQLIEYGVDAAYSIAHPNSNEFVVKGSIGILDSPKRLKSKRNKWLDEHFPLTSKTIKRIKKTTQFSSHSNLIDTHRNYRAEYTKDLRAEVSFFDFEDDYISNISLWQLSNTTLTILGLWYEVSKKHETIKITPNFVESHAFLMKMNMTIKGGFTESERFKKLTLEREK